MRNLKLLLPVYIKTYILININTLYQNLTQLLEWTVFVCIVVHCSTMYQALQRSDFESIQTIARLHSFLKLIYQVPLSPQSDAYKLIFVSMKRKMRLGTE